MAITVSFTDASTPGSSGPITARAWDFGDPPSGGSNTSTLTNPTHDYPGPAYYTVTLTVTGTSPDGKATIRKTIRVT